MATEIGHVDQSPPHLLPAFTLHPPAFFPLQSSSHSLQTDVINNRAISFASAKYFGLVDSGQRGWRATQQTQGEALEASAPPSSHGNSVTDHPVNLEV